MKILGQDHILQYIDGGLKSNRLSPSLLFVGPEGVGKRLLALTLAERLESKNSDLLVIDREYQSTLLKQKITQQTGIKIESVRQMEKFLRLKPMEGKKRVAIIDEADRLTNEAANALLKILEEPPAQTQIILLAHNEHNMPPTIASRCAVLRFRPIAMRVISQWLQDQYQMEKADADQVADRSHGSFSMAERLKDEEKPDMDLSTFQVDEFIQWVNEPTWRREGRARAEKVITYLVEDAQDKLNQGDLQQVNRIQKFLQARNQIDRNVPPRLVMENLFMEVEVAVR